VGVGGSAGTRFARDDASTTQAPWARYTTARVPARAPLIFEPAVSLRAQSSHHRTPRTRDPLVDPAGPSHRNSANLRHQPHQQKFPTFLRSPGGVLRGAYDAPLERRLCLEGVIPAHALVVSVWRLGEGCGRPADAYAPGGSACEGLL